MRQLLRASRHAGSLALAVVASAGLIAAVRAPFAVRGVTYRVKVETRIPNFALGGGGGGGGSDIGGGGGGGVGARAGAPPCVELAGDPEKIQFQDCKPPGLENTVYYVTPSGHDTTYYAGPAK